MKILKAVNTACLAMVALCMMGCPTTKTYTVPILNTQEALPGLNMQIVKGMIQVPVSYGLCAGAKSGEVVNVTITLSNDGSPSGQTWFDESSKGVKSSDDVTVSPRSCFLWVFDTNTSKTVKK